MELATENTLITTKQVFPSPDVVSGVPAEVSHDDEGWPIAVVATKSVKNSQAVDSPAAVPDPPTVATPPAAAEPQITKCKPLFFRKLIYCITGSLLINSNEFSY